MYIHVYRNGPPHPLPQTIYFERCWVQLTAVYLYASLPKTAEITVFYVVLGGFRNIIRFVKLHACFIISMHSDASQYICASRDFSQIRILLLFVFILCVLGDLPQICSYLAKVSSIWYMELIFFILCLTPLV